MEDPVQSSQEKLFEGVLFSLGMLLSLLFFLLCLFLIYRSLPAFSELGTSLFTSMEWNPGKGQFGCLPFLFGTAVTSLLAILLAAPIAIGASAYLTEIAPPSFRTPLSFLIDMLAAIPSVVYGLWGVMVLVPWIRTSLGPALSGTLGFLPLFEGPIYGVGILSASLVLAVMILPTLSAVIRTVFQAIPEVQREGALALSATRFEMIKMAVLKPSKSGIKGAIMIGLGRALGETMAVTMVIGNRAEISWSVFSPAQTISSLIANEYGEATGVLHLSSLNALGVLLLLSSLFMNILARRLTRESLKRKWR